MEVLKCRSCGHLAPLACGACGSTLHSGRVLTLLRGIADQSINPGRACDEARAILDAAYRSAEGATPSEGA